MHTLILFGIYNILLQYNTSLVCCVRDVIYRQHMKINISDVDTAAAMSLRDSAQRSQTEIDSVFL